MIKELESKRNFNIRRFSNINLACIVSIIIVILLGISTIYFMYLNTIPEDHRVQRKIEYFYRYNNVTNNYQLILGDFVAQDGLFIWRANISISFNNISFSTYSDPVGRTRFEIPEQYGEKIIGTKIKGTFHKSGYHSAKFEFTINKLNETSEFNILLGTITG